MKRRPDKKIWDRWAIIRTANGALLGRYCWPDGHEDELPTRTFRTRNEAREAKSRMTSFRDESRVVRVEVEIRTMGVAP
jgi:hypothetical protein